MVQLVLLALVFVFVSFSDKQVDFHRDALGKQVEAGACDRVVLAYDCSSPLHVFHQFEQIGLIALLCLGLLSLIPWVQKLDVAKTFWSLSAVVVLLAILAGLGFEFIASGAENQFPHPAIPFAESLEVAELFELASSLVLVALLVLGPPESASVPMLWKRREFAQHI